MLIWILKVVGVVAGGYLSQTSSLEMRSSLMVLCRTVEPVLLRVLSYVVRKLCRCCFGSATRSKQEVRCQVDEE
jgi:hypothetical protein